MRTGKCTRTLMRMEKKSWVILVRSCSSADRVSKLGCLTHSLRPRKSNLSARCLLVFLEITPFDEIGEGMMKLYRDKQNDTDVRENKITSRATPRDINP